MARHSGSRGNLVAGCTIALAVQFSFTATHIDAVTQVIPAPAPTATTATATLLTTSTSAVPFRRARARGVGALCVWHRGPRVPGVHSWRPSSWFGLRMGGCVCVCVRGQGVRPFPGCCWVHAGVTRVAQNRRMRQCAVPHPPPPPPPRRYWLYSNPHSGRLADSPTYASSIVLGLKPSFDKTAASTSTMRPSMHSALCILPMLTGPSDEVGPSP